MIVFHSVAPRRQVLCSKGLISYLVDPWLMARGCQQHLHTCALTISNRNLISLDEFVLIQMFQICTSRFSVDCTSRNLLLPSGMHIGWFEMGDNQECRYLALRALPVQSQLSGSSGRIRHGNCFMIFHGQALTYTKTQETEKDGGIIEDSRGSKRYCRNIRVHHVQSTTQSDVLVALHQLLVPTQPALAQRVSLAALAQLVDEDYAGAEPSA